jgi:predicted RecA/RadA family phage recombinase
MVLAITSIEPDVGTAGETVEATIVGTDFGPSTVAELHGANGKPLFGKTTRESSTELTFVVEIPVGWTPQVHQLVVRVSPDGGGTQGVKALADAFEVEAPVAAASTVPKASEPSEVQATAAAAEAGDPVLDGDVFGIAIEDADEDDQVLLETTGTFALPRAAADTFVRNARVGWDEANGEATVEVGSPAFPVIGTAAEDQAAGAGTVLVRLFGITL